MHSRAHTAEMIRGLTGKLLPSSPEYPHQHVFSTELSPAPDDPWEARILDLCDGRHADDLKEAVFRQLASSGSGADIGLWKTAFEKELSATLGSLASRGYIRFE